MKTYRGNRGHDVAVVLVFDAGGKASPLKHLVRHSPSGFEWGFAGSGPADTARSLLADHLGFEPAQGVYMAFKFDVVARLAPTWTLDETAIAASIATIKEKLKIDCLRCGDRGYFDFRGDISASFCSCPKGVEAKAEMSSATGGD